ncbi:MAG: hypothetical protein COA60_009420 [Robiginitomaculum sp.]|nr:hypothetical protein [Robiginitomaculum sp.]
MLSKIIIIVASLTLLLQPMTGNAEQSEVGLSSALARSAFVTTCIGPMTLQLKPKNRGLFLVAFSAGGCSSAKYANGFALRFGKIANTKELKSFPVKMTAQPKLIM